MTTSTITFDLFHDSVELRQALLSASWECWYDDDEVEAEERLVYETELDGRKYYKVAYCYGAMEYTDDPAVAMGEIPDYDE